MQYDPFHIPSKLSKYVDIFCLSFNILELHDSLSILNYKYRFYLILRPFLFEITYTVKQRRRLLKLRLNDFI